jgi:5,10-methylenetetrahydromethanopterin reductase
MNISLLFPEGRSLDAVRDLAQMTEANGFAGMWIGSAFGFDSFVAIALAGQATRSIPLGIAVVPTWPRHPLVMAQSAATTNAACGGRFRLGIGASHKPVMRMYGVDFDRPISHLREYLDIVNGLLSDGHIQYEGERYRLTGFLDIADGGRPPVMVGVLREQMARLAGARSDGALSWLCPAPYLADVIAPALADGARGADRATPPLLAELPCALTNDRDEVHAMAAVDLAVYPQMPFYRAVFEGAGIDLPGREWTDAMIDATVLYGDEDALAAKIQTFYDAGAAEVVLSPFGVGADPAASQADCIRVLADLAKG